MDNLIAMYQNGRRILFQKVADIPEAIAKAKEYFSKQGKKIEDETKIFSIRMYFIEIDDEDKKNYKVLINSVNPEGKKINQDTAVCWKFDGTYKGITIKIQTFDKKDITYHIWEVIEYLLKEDNTKTISNLKFNLDVKTKKGEDYNQKQKLILFFSKKENCGKLWKYEEARKAMSKAGFAMVGRGIEGERPREFRYDLGYPFITSEQNKNVPDGSFMVEFPFPTMPRNERRNANVSLEKDDWSELLEILKKEPKKLRCFECGLFEGETNKIGQTTKFEKGHLATHSSGGDVSKGNITAICKYCNSEQKNVYSWDKITGKKIYHLVPFLKNRNYEEKLEALKYLMNHLKKEDVDKIAKEILK
ncbi:MAG: hypothetical protein NTU63_01910 [Candidatus Pacearchaeota archaeon]|nr:hypothetical protein [Candidatus Pacearchaeota archaeon]